MDDLLTTRQLEQLLQVDRITIYRMLGDGRLQGLKVGGQWRFPRAQVEAWLRSQRPELAAESPATSAAADEALPLSCIEAIQAVFAQARDVAAVTTDRDGHPITGVSNGCDFCALVLTSEKGRERCAAAWSDASGDPQPCHAGLLVAAAPVRIDGRVVAKAVACQFRAHDNGAAGSALELNHVAAEMGLDAPQLQQAAAAVHIVSRTDLPKLRPLLRAVADTYAEIGRERLKLLSRLQRIAEITALRD